MSQRYIDKRMAELMGEQYVRPAKAPRRGALSPDERAAAVAEYARKLEEWRAKRHPMVGTTIYKGETVPRPAIGFTPDPATLAKNRLAKKVDTDPHALVIPAVWVDATPEAE